MMLKKAHLDFLFGFMHGFLYTNMIPVVALFWVFLSKFIAYVFGSILGYLLRSSANKCFPDNESGACSDHVDQGNREAENSSLVASSSQYEFLYGKGFSGFIEEPKAESYTVDELYMGSYDLANCNAKILVSRDAADDNIGKVEVEAEDFNEEKVEDPGESFIVEKVFENSLKVNVIDERVQQPEESALRFFFEKTFEKHIKQEQSVDAKVRVEVKEDDSVEEKPEHDIIKTEDVVQEIGKDSVEKPKHGKIETEDTFEEKAEESVENYIIEKSLEKHASDIEGNGDHVEENFDNFFESPVIDMYLEKWLQEKEETKKDDEMFSQRNMVDVESITYQVLANRLDIRRLSYVLTDGQNMENMEHECNRNISDQEAATLRGPINDSDEEFIESEPRSEKLCVLGETESGEDLCIKDEGDEEEFNYKETESMVSPENAKGPISLEEFISSSYDEQEDDSEFASEEYDLMERLKMEMKIARTGGLPTILEEYESPKMVEQLGPLKIEEKYDHKYHIAEIQKVYKGYSNKMRKLDILNSQTIYAISLLQLKDPVRLSSTFGKPSAPAIKSLLSHNVWPFKQRKPEAGPAMKLIRVLHMDFEIVYVGQVCLSWEILQWQYGKVKKSSECDSLGFHQYNQVAGEFQHFQVLLQRLLEDEPFQNRSRVENYTKSRCALRHLLQVPVIKDDCSKYKLEDAMSNGMLTDIIEESMHVFGEFLHADKDDANATSKTPQQAQVSPHDPIDLELLMDVRTDLQKKEKRLKEIQRSTNCIIKKFRRQHEGNLLDHASFIAQVELKLVSRVLNMLKISTDQLVWCHEKLQRINFRSRKIEIEPSFKLFPC